MEQELSNDYFALRHGFSTPQKEGRIVSNLNDGIDHRNGLADHQGISGVSQVRMSVTNAFLNGTFNRSQKIIIAHSPFSRAKKSAEVGATALARLKPELIEMQDLRERFFGVLDLGPNDRYQDVWALDERDMHHTTFEVESVASVIERVRLNVVQEMERRFADCHIILSSHGDILQITETMFRGLHPSAHRTLPALQNGELRHLGNKIDVSGL